MGPFESLRAALAVMDGRARAMALASAALVTVERGLVVAVAVLIGRDDRTAAFAVTAAALALWSARAVLRVLLRARLQKRLYRAAADALLGSDPLVATPLGDDDPHSVLIDGVHQGGELAGERLPAAAGDLVSALGVLAFLALTQPPTLLAAFVVAIVVGAAVGAALRRTTARAEDAAWEAYRPLLDRMLVAIRGRLELVANGVDGAFSRALDEPLDGFERAMVRADRVAGLAGRAPVAAAAAGALAVVALHGSLREVRAAALADAVLLASVLPAFVGLAQSAHRAYRQTLAFRPMAALLCLAAREDHRGGASPPARPSSIVLTGVAFRYPSATRDAVRDVSLTFTPGEVLVLSGPNGSGKSTVLRLIGGVGTPSRGTIAAASVDLATVDLSAWRQSVAMLPQQPFLPETATVGEAMRMTAAGASDEAIRAALGRVGVLDALEARAPSRPLDVKVAALSGGQRKRVAIARVLLRDAAVVLLDEPDANLDAEGVAMVERLVHELAKTRLVAVAAHTPGLVRAKGVHVELAA